MVEVKMRMDEIKVRTPSWDVEYKTKPQAQLAIMDYWKGEFNLDLTDGGLPSDLLKERKRQRGEVTAEGGDATAAAAEPAEMVPLGVLLDKADVLAHKGAELRKKGAAVLIDLGPGTAAPLPPLVVRRARAPLPRPAPAVRRLGAWPP